MKKTNKYQIWYEISKIAGVMHTFIFVGRALGANNARHCGEKHHFEGGMKRKKTEANGQRSDNSKSNTKKTIFEADWGSKKWCFWWKMLEVVLQKCASRSGEKHIFEKCGMKSELEQKIHAKSVLQLTFLMQIRIKSWPARLFFSSLGTG